MKPDTIVLVHGFWVTPRSWEHWKAHYEQQGYRVLAPAYPGYEVEVEALNADPTPITKVTVPGIIDHLEAILRDLPAPPIIMGHSAGARSRRSCSTTDSAPSALPSTPLPPRASSWRHRPS
jgi:pimeloyl-ACP methyl ester carboxylesterase